MGHPCLHKLTQIPTAEVVVPAKTRKRRLRQPELLVLLPRRRSVEFVPIRLTTTERTTNPAENWTGILCVS